MKQLIFLLILLSFPIFSVHAEEFKIFTEAMPPYNYEDEVTLEAKGFSVEIVKELLKRTKITLTGGKIHVWPWARAYELIQIEKNVMLFSMTKSKARENMFKWVGPIASRTIWLWKLKKRKDIVIKSIEDAKKYTVGGVHEFASTKYLQKLGFDVETVPLIKHNWLKLFEERIDLVSALELEAAFNMNKLGKSFHQLDRVIKIDDRYSYYIAFSKYTDEKIVNQLQKALNTMKTAGTFKNIKKKYLK